MADRMRTTVEAIEGHEAIVEGHDIVVEHWIVIAADGAVTTEERLEHMTMLSAQTATLAVQTRRLGLWDIVDKWIVRLYRTGINPRKEAEMLTEIEEALAA